MLALRVLLTIHAPAEIATDDMVAIAAAIYQPAGVEVAVKMVVPIDHLEIGSVRGRDALAEQVARDGTVHVFLVDRLADKERESDVIGGVHWYHRGKRYLIVSLRDGRPDTLAHELGHWFGLHHTHDRTNLMMTPDRIAEASLSPAQIRRVRARSR